MRNRGFKTCSFFLVFTFCCSFCAFAQTKIATDPTRICVGARPLGMGKAFVAVANDASAAFVNPAGLGGQLGWKFTSMSSKFINEVNYLSLSSLYNTRFGTFAISYVGSNLGAVTPSTTLESVGGIYKVIEITGETDSFSYNNNVMMISYGRLLKEFWNLEQLSNLYGGFSVKLFSQGLTGKTITGGIASGYDLDLGFLYLPYPWLSVGLMGQNILPKELGGKLIWPVSSTRPNPVEEDLPAVGKLGLAFKLVGEGAPLKSGENELVFALDGEYASGKSGAPPLLHLGVEWWPVSAAALRMGIDQDFVGSGGGVFDVSNNLTAGVSIAYKDFAFDYAYHQYNSLSQNDTHYLSLSFAIIPPGLRPPEKVTKVLLAPPSMLIVDSPTERKLVVYDDRLKIKGKVLDPKIQMLKINNLGAKVEGMSSFEAETELAIGKNIIQIIAQGKDKNKLEEIDLEVLRLRSFVDVAKGYFAQHPVEYLSTLGIIAGYPDGTFKPEGTINRAELATLLVKAKEGALPQVNEGPFKDIAVNHWAAPYIKKAVEEGYVRGYPDGTFKPQKDISRIEGILVVSRFAGLSETPTLAEGPFPDLPGRHWAAKMVDAAKNAGILDYLHGQILKPNQSLTRGEAAEMISKTPQINQRVQDLLAFGKESGEPFLPRVVFLNTRKLPTKE